MSGHTKHEMRFTPGPWIVCNGKDIFTNLGGARADGSCADEDDGWQVADCSVGVTFIDGVECTLPIKEQEANARLIAAAPELLAALEYLIERCDASDDHSHGTLSTTFVRIFAQGVIAKATVEQP